MAEYIVSWGWYDDGETSSMDFDNVDDAYIEYHETVFVCRYGSEYGPGPDWAKLKKDGELIEHWDRINNLYLHCD